MTGLGARAGTLVIVPTERQVELCAIAGERAETRAALRERLLSALAPDVVLAPPEAARAVLDDVMPGLAAEDTRMARVQALGGAAWLRLVDAVQASIASLRAAGVTSARAIETPEVAVLGRAMRAVDERLAARGLVDGARAAELAADAARRVGVERVRAAVGADRLVARWLVAWDGADVSLWRALARALPGGAVVELPAIERPLDAMRLAGPLDALIDDVTSMLAEPAHAVALASAPLGEATEGDAVDPRRVAIAACTDAEAQAAAVAHAVSLALAEGAPLDRVAVVVPGADEEALGPIRRALEDARLPVFDGRGRAPADAGVVYVALEALGLASRGMPRAGVAALLRSRYVDACLVTGIAAPRAARRALDDLADALERTAAIGDGPAGLERTALKYRAPWEDRDPDASARRGALARRVGEALAPPLAAKTRAEHLAACRAILEALGLDPRAGGRPAALARDEAPRGVDRVEVLALARDEQAWEALEDALGALERGARVAGALDAEATSEAVVHELATALMTPSRPRAAARAGALRLVRPVDVAGDELDVVIVAEATDAALPGRRAGAPLVTDAAAERLRTSEATLAPRPASIARARALAEIALVAERAGRVVIAWRARGPGGEDLGPAEVVRAAERAKAPRAAWTASPVGGRATRDRRLAALAAAPDDDAEVLAPDAVRRARVEHARERWHSTHKASTMESQGAPSVRPHEVVGRLEVDAALAPALLFETGGGARPLAVTALERFATCPFQGFAGVLSGSTDEATRETPDAREEGNLVHDALRAAFEAAREDLSRRPRDEESIVRAALAAVDVALDRDAYASAVRRVVLARVRAEVEEVVRAAVRDEQWDFALAEKAFGRRGAEDDPAAWAALDVGSADTPLAVRGTIDRVDLAHTSTTDAPRAARVLDYKRRLDRVPATELGEKRLQLLLYALVVARELGAPSVDGTHLRTRAPSDGEARGFDALWAEWRAPGRTEERAREIVAALRAGDLAPRPGTACAMCAFDGACRRPRFAVPEVDDGAPAEDETPGSTATETER